MAEINTYRFEKNTVLEILTIYDKIDLAPEYHFLEQILGKKKLVF